MLTILLMLANGEDGDRHIWEFLEEVRQLKRECFIFNNPIITSNLFIQQRVLHQVVSGLETPWDLR